MLLNLSSMKGSTVPVGKGDRKFCRCSFFLKFHYYTIFIIKTFHHDLSDKMTIYKNVQNASNLPSLNYLQRVLLTKKTSLSNRNNTGTRNICISSNRYEGLKSRIPRIDIAKQRRPYLPRRALM